MPEHELFTKIREDEEYRRSVAVESDNWVTNGIYRKGDYVISLDGGWAAFIKHMAYKEPYVDPTEPFPGVAEVGFVPARKPKELVFATRSSFGPSATPPALLPPDWKPPVWESIEVPQLVPMTLWSLDYQKRFIKELEDA